MISLRIVPICMAFYQNHKKTKKNYLSFFLMSKAIFSIYFKFKKNLCGLPEMDAQKRNNNNNNNPNKVQ